MPPKSKTSNSKHCASDKENEDSDFKPSKAKKKTTCERFVKKSDEEWNVYAEDLFLGTFRRATSWATKVFHEWLCSRNKESEEHCPEDLVGT